jgi:hypothetical protein
MTSYSGLPYATYGTCSRINICGNTISGNTNVGFYNDATNSYANGSRNNFLATNIIKNNVNGPAVGDFTSWILIDDVRMQTNLMTLTAHSSGNYANLYSSSSGNCSFVFPPSIGDADSLLMTDGVGNSRWDSAVKATSAVVGPTASSAVNLRVNGVSSTLGSGVVAAGSAQAIPTNPLGWLVINVNGSNVAIPYFTQYLI